MNIRAVRTIYHKEMLEMVRDRRTLLSMVLVPIIAMPLLFKVANFFLSSQRRAGRARGHDDRGSREPDHAGPRRRAAHRRISA